ncbi:MAG: DNA adenine methylase, partial [Candidatus Sericytochromatia bacterium]
MNYIGSKLSLLDEMRGMLQRQGATTGTFCDMFSGTTVVAQMARGAGFRVIANDMQAYSWVMQKAFLETEGYPDFAALMTAQPAIAGMPADTPRPAFGLGPAPGHEAAPLRRVLAWLEALPPVSGAFYETYCEGGEAGRSYFSQENGRRLEAIRGAIEGWRQQGLLDEREFHLLLASLIESMDHLANTASVYGAYLKHVKKTARQPLVLRLPRLFTQPGPHAACQKDANELVKHLAAAGPHDVL